MMDNSTDHTHRGTYTAADSPKYLQRVRRRTSVTKAKRRLSKASHPSPCSFTTNHPHCQAKEKNLHEWQKPLTLPKIQKTIAFEVYIYE